MSDIDEHLAKIRELWASRFESAAAPSPPGSRGKAVTEHPSGHSMTTVDGHLHSDEDEPAVVYADGTKWWYRQGKVHRDSGPAVVWSNGVEEWWQNGLRHRDDGPAVTYPDSPKISHELRGTKQWWEHGKLVRREVAPHLQGYHLELMALRQKYFKD